MPTLRSRALGAALLLAALACNGDVVTRPAIVTTGKALVLITYGEPGVSVVGDTGRAVAHVDFGDAYDGVAFSVVGDTAYSTSSKSGGDQLFAADVHGGTVRVTQLPAGSNPGGVAALPAGFPGARGADVAVALRDSGMVALVTLARGASPANPTLAFVRGAGVCPSDVVLASGTVWSVDSNLNCRDQYQPLGAARLIGAVVDSARRDTVALTGAYGTVRAFVAGATVFVVASGDFADHPGTISRVRTTGRLSAEVERTLALPAGYYVTSSRLGRDGRLYVTASEPYPADYLPRVFAVDPATMTLTGTRATGRQFLDLRAADGALARCDAATADADGTIYCASNAGVSSRLLVFSRTGALLRDVPTGGLAADIEVR